MDRPFVLSLTKHSYNVTMAFQPGLYEDTVLDEQAIAPRWRGID